MAKNIEIKWTNNSGEHGCMTLYTDEFFPASIRTLKKLLTKVIALDYEHQDDIIRQIEEYCTAKISELEVSRKDIARDYADSIQKVSDLKPLIEFSQQEVINIQETKKFVFDQRKKKELTDRLKIKTAHLKELKKEMQQWNRAIKDAINRNNSSLKQIKLLKKNLEILKQRK